MLKPIRKSLFPTIPNGRLLKCQRVKKRVTRKELAREIGLSTSQLRHIENGISKLTLKNWRLAAAILKCDPDILLSRARAYI